MAVGFDDRAHFVQERFDVLFGRFDQQLALVLTYVLSQEVEALIYIGQPGFLG